MPNNNEMGDWVQNFVRIQQAQEQEAARRADELRGLADRPAAPDDPAEPDLDPVNRPIRFIPWEGNRLVPAEPQAINRLGRWNPARMQWGDEIEQPNTNPTGKRGEELFQLILSGIREVYDVDAIIAGGAVRDVAAKASNHKDVDLFIPMTTQTFMERWSELGWAGIPGNVPEKPSACAIKSIGRMSATVQGCPVDMIFLEEPLSAQQVDSFPIHAQRCVWTLGKGTDMSPEALTDITNKTFTISPNITDKEHIKYLIAKAQGWLKRPDYKDWELVYTEPKDWWSE